MQSAYFNVLYAQSIPALQKNYILGSGQSSDQLNAVRALLLDVDDYDFGSAAWFLTTQCSGTVRQGLEAGGRVGWETYLTKCVGTTATSDRDAYWQRAVHALGS